MPRHRIPFLVPMLLALVLTCGEAAAQSPYAGQQSRAIKALSPEEIDDLLQARGMGLAKAAELNSYPGPLHALDLKAALGLSAAQERAIAESRARMLDAALPLGRDILEEERALDRLFAESRIEPAALQRQTLRLGTLQGRLRAVHLAAHLEVKDVLTPAQVARYDELRGYRLGGNSVQPRRDGEESHGTSHAH